MPVLVAVCPTCNIVRYKSNMNLESPEQCIPENFSPVGEAPPVAGMDMPLCHECSSMLAFGREEALATKPAPQADLGELPSHKRRVIAPPQGVVKSEISGEIPDVETLFKVAEGETVRDIFSRAGGIIVVTDRRIVRVNLGGS